MRKTENYGSILKKLLCFTDTKFVVLSKVVGYDISYISKWCNNIKIPTSKNIENINERAAIFFSEQIIKRNIVKEFWQIFGITQPIEMDDSTINDILKNHIYDFLDNAYKKSETELCEKNEKKHDDSKIIVGKNQVTKFIREIISTTIQNSTTDIELLSTIDICKATANINLDTMKEYTLNDIRVSAKVGFNMEEFETNPNFYLWRIYFILNKKWNIEFEFFDNKNMDKLNIIAIRDKFAIILALDSDGLADAATVITDHETVNKIYDKTIAKFTKGDLLIRCVEPAVLEQSGYRTDFYSNDEFQFVSTRGFEFLLPYDIISDIIEAAYNQGFGDKTAFLLRKLQITWEERFEKGKIDFIILKSALMKYIEEGDIFYTDVRYKLPVEQRKAHAHKIVESMKKNNNIKITILNDELLNYDVNFFKISVNVNNKKVFLKKHLKGISSSVPSVYTIINENLVKYINEYLLMIKNKDFCAEYDVDAVEQAVEEYGNMFFRIMETKN
ncbi:hypothetical protein [Clostridium sp. ZS2-4]|uniref:hypothetical protein n=1 Tax=Clostridium sp. ZS2-4 TaxID=2987703 RepID=UPI00227B6944|nr:hypothetical protein [Clostridium sp. ZS2-4]MCY6355549.1 hypothetical protein [Clostridium sp. ZS2-4]